MPLESQVSSDPPGLPPSPAGEEAGSAPASEEVVEVAPIWLQRLSLLVLVLFCVYLGGLVTILPWWSRVWDHNVFLQRHPALSALMHTGAVKGLISGLGLLDIWIGISEAMHYRDHRR